MADSAPASDSGETPAWLAGGVARHASSDDELENSDRCPATGGDCPGSACGRC